MRKFIFIFGIFILFLTALCGGAFADLIVPQVDNAPLSKKELQGKEFLEACKAGKLSAVKKLIAAGVDVNADYSRSIPIKKAHVIYYPNEEREKLRQTPLCAASEAGHLDIVKALVMAGADVNKRSSGFFPSGTTPLMSAAYGGHNEVVKYLIEAGADVNFVEKGIGRSSHFGYLNGGSPLRAAISQGHLETFKILRKAGAKTDKGMVIAAVEGRHADILKLLIDEGEDISFKDNNGRTLLMPTVICTPVEIVKILLDQKKIDIKAVDHHNGGQNALTIAAEHGCNDVIPLFLEAGLEVDSRKENGETALMCASRTRQYEAIRTLLAAGAKINAEDKTGGTALVTAALSIGMGNQRIPPQDRFSARDLETIKILVSAGADVNKKGPFGKTPLMFMTEYGTTQGETAQKNLKEIIQILLKAGADTNAKDDKGNTALILAEKTGNKEIIKLLEESSGKNLDTAKKEILEASIKKELKRKDKLMCIYNKKLKLPQKYNGPDLKIEDKKGESFRTGIMYHNLYIDERYAQYMDRPSGYGYSSVMFYDEEGCNEYWPVKKNANEVEADGYVKVTNVPADSFFKYIPESKKVKVLLSESKYYNNYIIKRKKDVEEKTEEFQKSIATGNAIIMKEGLKKYQDTLKKDIGFYKTWDSDEKDDSFVRLKEAQKRFKE